MQLTSKMSTGAVAEIRVFVSCRVYKYLQGISQKDLNKAHRDRQDLEAVKCTKKSLLPPAPAQKGSLVLIIRRFLQSSS